MKDWNGDKLWADRFTPFIKPILGTYLIGPAPVEDDQERNTDLIVLKMDAVRIGCRIRRWLHWQKYGGEFTIRCSRPSGMETELTKIIKGWGNYFFYGFANATEDALAAWKLCDLNVFRLWFNRYLRDHQGKVPGIKKPNLDGSSEFGAFRFAELPNEFVVADCVPTADEAVAVDEPQTEPEQNHGKWFAEHTTKATTEY